MKIKINVPIQNFLYSKNNTHTLFFEIAIYLADFSSHIFVFELARI